MCDSASSCGCTTTAATPAPGGDVEATYTVAGKTCGGCASTVNKHLSGVAGVTGVQIDVAGGAVTLTSDTPVDATDVRAAVERAGFQLVD